MELPRSISDVTPGWLNQILPETLRSDEIQVVSIADGVGIFSDILRVTSDQFSLIVKLPCSEPENLEVANALGLHEREARFLTDVAAKSTFSTPHIYFLEHQPPDMVIVMEDLSQALNTGDQIVGASFDQAGSLIDELAKLHAEWWMNPALDAMDWLPAINSPANLATVPGIFMAGLEPLKARANQLPPGSMELCEKLAPRFESLMNHMATGPNTVIHGDTRWDNVFFDDQTPPTVRMIDFQICFKARGIHDVAYFISNSLRIEEQHRWQELIQQWHNNISARGIKYSWEDCLLHYKQSVLYTLVGALSLVGTFDTANERGAQMTQAYLDRSFSHVLEIGAIELIDQLG